MAGLFGSVTNLLFGSPPAAPAAPDYTGAAKEQGVANLEAARATAKLSNPNIFSPYGNQTVTYDGDTPTITQTLTPEAQKTLNEQQLGQYGLAQLGNKGVTNAGAVFNTPFSFGGPSVQTSLAPVGQAKGGVAGPNLSYTLDTSNVAQMPINAGTTAQEAIMSRLEPQLQRNRVSAETQLINQGLRPGTEAYDNAATLLAQQENDQRRQAVLEGLGLDMSANAQGYGQALTTGQFGNESRLAGFNADLTNQQAENAAIAQNFNQNQQTAQFGNTAQQQALAQAITQRQLPLNEINALMSGSQIQNPQFQQYTGANVAAAPIANATAQLGAFDQNLYNQNVGTYNQNVAGLYGLGGSAAYGYGKRTG
jgi:hypothetical protein